MSDSVSANNVRTFEQGQRKHLDTYMQPFRDQLTDDKLKQIIEDAYKAGYAAGYFSAMKDFRQI